MSHTPGPWEIDEPHQIWAKSVGEYVAITKVEQWETIPREQAEANARLMAAAPELLETLKNLHDAYIMFRGDFPLPHNGCYIEMMAARAAIAKAEGA
jgi:hypothetical protein